MTRKYEWKNNSDQSVWTLDLFNAKKGKLPFLGTGKSNIASHQLEIRVYNPRAHNRPYRLEKDSENSDKIAYKKIFLSDYKGNVDANIYLRYLDWMDAESRHIAYFLGGKFKDAYNQHSNPIKNLEEFEKSLTDYFKTKPAFGEHLKDLIINSNLPKKQRDAVKDLWS